MNPRKLFVLALATGAALAVPAAAQTPAPPQTATTTAATIRLTVDEAVKLAMQHNPDLAADRIDPQIAEMRVKAVSGLFRPTATTGVSRTNALQPPSNLLSPTATRNDAITTSAGVSELLPFFGTSYNVAWNTVHTESNSFLNSYNPLVTSGLTVSLSQPLLKNLFTDPTRTALRQAKTNRDIAGTRLTESTVRTVASVKSLYWGLVSARATVEVRKTALELARELARVNKAKVDVGQSPPLDLVSAQAEVASNEEQLIIAEAAVKQTEDRLRTAILDTRETGTWTAVLEPVDSPPVGNVPVDLTAAVANALKDRADLERARKDIENASTSVKLATNQKLPDVRVNASYVANGLGGTQVLRTGGFPGTIVGPGEVTSFGTVLGQVFGADYPTWVAGVSVSYPIGSSVESANLARTRLERSQAEERLKSAEARAIQQVRDAAWKIEMNQKRIDTTRAARQLAEQRLDSERKRFEVGMSTSFLVIQAQRDLAQAKTNELSAILAYDLALVDFEALQKAAPRS